MYTLKWSCQYSILPYYSVLWGTVCNGDNTRQREWERVWSLSNLTSCANVLTKQLFIDSLISALSFGHSSKSISLLAACGLCRKLHNHPNLWFLELSMLARVFWMQISALTGNVEFDWKEALREWCTLQGFVGINASQNGSVSAHFQEKYWDIKVSDQKCRIHLLLNLDFSAGQTVH